MPAPVVDSVLDLVGETPVVRLRRLSPDGGATIWGKCEHLNPGGSVKDRICLAMIEAAEAQGRLTPGDTIVEPTSGNTGIGLALVCARKGYKLVLTMPASMSLERRALLEAYGVEIVLTEPQRVMEGAMEAARRVVEERGAFMPEQFSNPANPGIHMTTTASELLRAFEGQTIDAFVAAVGTGGTVSGVGETLKAHNPSTRVIAVEPAASPVLIGGEPGPTKIQGLNAGFVPENYHPEVVDEVIGVSDRDAWETKLSLATDEGLLLGISAGANVWAARQVAKSLGPGKTVITILCDTGERYFSLGEYFQ
ncbi:MAG: cysteine synthase [Myxococcales bacterium SG8_38_1]|jgi:cysteine synthase A|nr:MAG: cysteine synthase [Myxococcales bacterium SG8_38_1]